MINEPFLIQANYRDPGVSHYRGNPFIEALPPLKATKKEFIKHIKNYPAKPKAADRKKGEILRILELANLNQIVHPLPEYSDLEIAISALIRESYYARNPITASDMQRRHAIAAGGDDGVPFPADWKSSAKGFLITGLSGMGKTTYIDASLLQYPQVIEHTQYKEYPLKCRQLVWLKVRIPSDGTLRGFCIHFFQEVDLALGTNYRRQALSIGSMSSMTSLMRQTATAISLGVIFIDELQNLRMLQNGDANAMLDFFGSLCEDLGTGIVMVGTPAVEQLFTDSIRNIRKICSAGSQTIERMKKNDLQWQFFCEVLWEYQWVKNKQPLTKEIMDVWYHYTQGITAFAVLFFALAQRRAIGNSEEINIDVMSLVAHQDMAFLQPALTALASNNPALMKNFDDLVFSQEFKKLEAQIGKAVNSGWDRDNTEEFEEISASQKTETLPNTKTKVKSDGYVSLKTDDPHQPNWK